MGRIAVLEKVRLVAFIAALGLTVVAGFAWLMPEATATIRDVNGEWVGIDCSGDEPEGRSFNPQTYRVADARAACTDLDVSNAQGRLTWTLVALTAWGGASLTTRIPVRPSEEVRDALEDRAQVS